VLLVAGPAPVDASLAGSRWAWARGERGGTLPALDLTAHRAVTGFVRDAVAEGSIAGAHDVADGGLALALAEAAVRSGVGFRIGPGVVAGTAGLFGESPSRIVLCVAPDRAGDVVRAAMDAGVAIAELGRAGGDRLVVDGLLDVAVAEAAGAWSNRLPDALGAGTTQG
jgi:phosphoribosylformylglycinamidine synthase